MSQAGARKLGDQPSGVLEEILYGSRSAASRGEGRAGGDLGAILYRDPESARQVEHRSFRLTTPRALPTVIELAARLREEPEGLADEHRSFRLTRSSRKKATIYFYKKIHWKLKHAVFELKRIFPEEFRGRISMSRVVNYALVLVLHDLDRKGERSVLARTMLDNMRKAR